MSLGPLAVVLLLPVALVVGLRTHRWTRVIVVGCGAAIAALVLHTAAVIMVVAALLAMIGGAVLIGTGAHEVRRPAGTLGLVELVAGGLVLRWWRRRQLRRWSGSWARLVRQPKL